MSTPSNAPAQIDSVPRSGILPNFTICGVDRLEQVSSSNFTHVISIWDSAWARSEAKVRNAMVKTFPQSHLHLAFFDDAEEQHPGETLFSSAHMERILRFSETIVPGAPVLVHCFAGLSRSPAVAFVLACRFDRSLNAGFVLDGLLEKHPTIAPNRHIVKIGDALLERSGELIEAATAHWLRMTAKFTK